MSPTTPMLLGSLLWGAMPASSQPVSAPILNERIDHWAVNHCPLERLPQVVSLLREGKTAEGGYEVSTLWRWITDLRHSLREEQVRELLDLRDAGQEVWLPLHLQFTTRQTIEEYFEEREDGGEMKGLFLKQNAELLDRMERRGRDRTPRFPSFEI